MRVSLESMREMMREYQAEVSGIDSRVMMWVIVSKRLARM
jgi:hypothetical protein